MSRPRVPADLKRRLFAEAGYRCSVPTCRAKSALQMEHIEDWAKAKDHEFDNMIVLCATCHARVTSGEIPKSAIRAYKRNLAVVNARYSLFEMRLLEAIFESGRLQDPEHHVTISETDFLHVKGLVDDSLASFRPGGGLKMAFGGQTTIGQAKVHLTDNGRAFTTHYFQGEELGP